MAHSTESNRMDFNPATGVDPAAQQDCVLTLSQDTAPRTDCFTNFREAMAFATDREILDAPLTGAEAIRSAAFHHQLSMDFQLVNHENTTTGSGQILSIEYEFENFRGNTLTYRGAGGCDSDIAVDYSTSAVGPDWNDDISSYATANQCQVRHFEDENFGGAFSAYSNGDASMGILNNETSALKWR